MSILNLNGTERKHGIATGQTIKGRILAPGLASRQHGTVGFVGRTYNAQFTASGKTVNNTGRTTATQPYLPALKVESPGQVVPLHEFIKVHPHEKGSHFVTNLTPKAIVRRAGGPSKHADTAANPNTPNRVPRPKRTGTLLQVEKQSHLSFLRSGGTMGGHSDPQAGTSSGVSRWATIKKGAVE